MTANDSLTHGCLRTLPESGTPGATNQSQRTGVSVPELKSLRRKAVDRISIRSELVRLWPQIAFALAVAFGAGAFQALASQTDHNHEVRIKHLESSTPVVQRELGAMKAQTDATAKAVERIEQKLDRLLERDS